MAEGGPLPDLDWIAADWGTSSLRVWALGPAGNVLARASSPAGMGRLASEDYERTLLGLAGGWLPAADRGAMPVIVCGMAGARHGWQEAAYCAVPCPPVAGGSLTAVRTSDPRLDVKIIPGLSQSSPPDVMRGEETQLAGLVANGVRDGIVCMPGTHSKWTQLEDGAVASFRTFMTGELFALLGEHSILRHSVEETAEDDRAAFLEAVGHMIDAPQNLTCALFSIRARGLLSTDGEPNGRAMLSGFLIGAELAACRPLWEGRELRIIGARDLAARYAEALAHVGAAPVLEDAEALTLAGLKQARASMTEARA